MYKSNNTSRSKRYSEGRFNKQSNSNYSRKRKGQPTFDPTYVILKSKNQTASPIQEIESNIEHQFADFEILDQLKINIEQRGYLIPTAIQDQVIPHILENRDIIGVANTGTGKTAAFLIPLINKVLQNNNQKVLIIAPTRELAIQIRDDLKSFTNGMNIFSTIVIGGSSISRQIDSLRRGQDFVIGTPGRIKDLNERGKINFEKFNNIVLDEVDRMLDMGFVHEIRNIIQRLPKDRQSLFFSATMTDRVQDIMKDFLTNPVKISTRTQETSQNVEQGIIKVNGQPKVELLHELLISEEFEKVLVFGRTKRGAEKLKRDLMNKGHRVDAIHGNKSQSQRQRALKSFKDNKVQTLIATDVVARGLDISDITHVINYDLPESYEVYIHRIGRTGRASSKGIALTFIE